MGWGHQKEEEGKGAYKSLCGVEEAEAGDEHGAWGLGGTRHRETEPGDLGSACLSSN